MRKLYVLLTVLLILPFMSKGQVFVQNTMFPFNKFIYNPAAAGASGYTNITGMFRAQWRSIPGAPTLFTLGADAPIRQIRGGLGGYMISDKLGPLTTTGANLSYAFRFALGDPEDEKTPSLAIGAQAGFMQKNLNGFFVFDQQGGIDPIMGAGNYAASIFTPNLGAGVYFSGPNDKYYAGVSAQDLLEPSLQGLLMAGTVSKARVPRSYYAMGGYTFDFSDRVSLQPNVAFRTDGRTSQLDMNALVNIKPMVFGIAHRWKDSFSGIAGFNVSDRFFFAYSYDYTLSGLNSSRDVHSHELILSYRFPRVERTGPVLENIFGK